MALGLAGAYLVLVVFAIMRDPLGLSGSGTGHFPNALLWSLPAASDLAGLDTATAQELDRRNQGRDINDRLRFVDARTPSSGNLVVSVNPIDRFTWSATALASNHRCYALLVALDRNNPRLGTTLFAKFPGGTPCEAERATPETVTLKDPPE